MTDTKLLIVAVTALASVVGVLFKLYLSKSKESTEREVAITKERESWNTERARVAGDHKVDIAKLEAAFELKELSLVAAQEKKFRELVEQYDSIARRDSEAHLKHLDSARKDFADLMERIAAEHGKSSDALVQLMQKMYERFAGPRR